MPPDSIKVEGYTFLFIYNNRYDFNKGVDFHKLMESYKSSGFQASAISNAIDEVNRMVYLYITND